MKLEDAAYEDWKQWAIKETAALKQLQNSAYTGNEEAEEEMAPGVKRGDEEELQQVEESIPATKKGQEARGGAPIHP
jgi:small subunit ribosomal protein S23